MKKTDWKIFLVDDDAFNLQLTRHHLESIGYTDIQTFVNGTDCLNRLMEHPNVILLDHRMDDITGFEVLKKIKRYDPNIHVVMLSAQESIETAIASMRHGAFDYIVKGRQAFDQLNYVIHRLRRLQEMLDHQRPSLWSRIVSFL
jgi:DNA-binding NtrC family response regulator